MTVAYSELTRVLPWSLRALGYSFGVSDRASFIVATAAAMAPEILDRVGEGRDRAPAKAQVENAGTAGLSVSAGGLSLIEVGPVTIDLISARAPQQGFLRCAVIGATDLELLPSVLLIGADYGLSCLALVQEEEAWGWILQIASHGSRRIVRGTDPRSLDAALATAPSGLAEAARLAWQAGSAGEGIMLFATREPVVLPPDVVGAEVIDANERVTHAYRKGVPIKPETLHAIYNIEKRTWAPSSERSRAQAGFQQAPGGAAS